MANGEESNAVVDKAKDVANTAVQQSGSFFSNLFSSPFKMIKGVFSGAFSGLTNIFGSLVTGGVVAGLAKFAPDFVNWLPFKIGGQKVGDKLAEMAKDTPTLLINSAIAGVAINTGIGAIKGGLGEAMGSSTESTSTGGKIGGFVGATAVTVGAVMLAANALKKSNTGVDFSGAASHADVTAPTLTSAKPSETAPSKA